MTTSPVRAKLLHILLLSRVASTSSTATARLFERASASSRRNAAASAAFLRASEVPEDSLARTLSNLDSNHDGAVSPQEIQQFAVLQGLDAGAVVQEFSGLDLNGDGILDKREIASVLESSPPVKAEPVTSKDKAQAAPVNPVGPTRNSQDAAPSESTRAATEAHSVVQTESHADTQLSAEEMSVRRALAASQIVQLVKEEEKQTKEAEKDERLAAETRANSTAMAKAAEQEALLASSNAAKEKSKEILTEVTSLLSNAKKFEVQAAMLLATSSADMKGADTLMNVASSTGDSVARQT